jgi:hypothetical protein
MTQGETLFYLREIRTHWCTSNVSGDKLAELESAKLIERNGEPVPTVRLTSEGARVKALGQRSAVGSGIRLMQKPQAVRRRAPKRNVPRARRLV